MNKTQILDTIKSESNQAVEEGRSDGWVWTSEIGLFPLSLYSAGLRSLEKQGLIEISGCEAEVRSGWGRMVRPVGDR